MRGGGRGAAALGPPRGAAPVGAPPLRWRGRGRRPTGRRPARAPLRARLPALPRAPPPAPSTPRTYVRAPQPQPQPPRQHSKTFLLRSLPHTPYMRPFASLRMTAHRTCRSRRRRSTSSSSSGPRRGAGSWRTAPSRACTRPAGCASPCCRSPAVGEAAGAATRGASCCGSSRPACGS